MRSSKWAVMAMAAWPATLSQASAHDHAVLRGRLVFADHEKPVVRILDLDTGEVTHTFGVVRPNPNFTMADDRRHVVVRSGGSEGVVQILDTGIVGESHGDHDDIEKLTPRLLDLAITGEKPSHVVSANGRIAIFFDGERPWERPSDPKVVLVDTAAPSRLTTWKSPAPQHGIAVPLGQDQLLVSGPNGAYAAGNDKSATSRPDRFMVIARDEKSAAWRVRTTFDERSRPPAGCERFHGNATLRGIHVFGCREGGGGGLLTLAQGKSGWTARRIAYPDQRRVSTIRGSAGRYLVGNYGSTTPYSAFIRIDPAAAKLTAADVLPVPGDQSVCRFGLSGDGKRLAHLTPDGVLRIYEVGPNWKEVASFEAVTAFDCAYGASTPTPDLAISGPRAFVSDPVNGRIREYNLGSLRQGLDVRVGGSPAHLASDSEGG